MTNDGNDEVVENYELIMIDARRVVMTSRWTSSDTNKFATTTTRVINNHTWLEDCERLCIDIDIYVCSSTYQSLHLSTLVTWREEKFPQIDVVDDVDDNNRQRFALCSPMSLCDSPYKFTSKKNITRKTFAINSGG